MTDRRTDRILIAIPRLHYMQRGKNVFFTVMQGIANTGAVCDVSYVQ